MIRLEHVTKVYAGGVQAVSDLCLEIGAGETLVLVGASGCGKTTALKMVNRLVEPSSGHIYVEDRELRQWDPIELRRRIGYVIQSVGLFPHMTVAENVSIVLRLLKLPKADTYSRAAEVLDMVGLDPDDYARRYPAELSGGQQQRIGVARALAADPPVILMDEPFGALDPITRTGLQQEFLDLKTRIRKTIVFVTHDISEAVVLGDRIAVMRVGAIEQAAPPDELILRPQTDFVRGFLGRHRFQLRLDAARVRDVLETDPDSLREAAGETQVKPLRADAPLSAAVEAVAHQQTAAVPVVDANGQTLGILHRDAVMNRIRDMLNGDD